MKRKRATNVRRRGAVYLAVLGASLIVLTVGVSALTAVRVQSRTAVLNNDVITARQHAMSAIELGRHWMVRENNWRETRGTGWWLNKQTIGDGTMSLYVSDPVDGDIANERGDRVRVRAVGLQGVAAQAYEVDLEPRFGECDALSHALYVTGSTRVRSGDSLTLIGAPAFSASNLRVDGSVIGAVKATSRSGTGTVIGKQTIAGMTSSAPASDIFEMYRAMASTFTLPNGDLTIERFVLSNNYNPAGATNSNGVYYLEHNGNLRLRDCRLRGTLVIRLQPGKKLIIDRAILFEPARDDFPVLLVEGDVEFRFSSDSSVLSESGTYTNFNPWHTPFKGSSDGDTSDTYPNEMRGLVHIRGSLDVTENSPRIRGLLVVEGNVDVDATLTVIYDDRYTDPAPSGYLPYAGFDPVPDTWRRVTP